MSSPSDFDPIAILTQRFGAAIRAAFPQAGDAEAMITASKQAGLGDFQSNAAMPLSKKVGKPPREVAAAIVAKLDVAGIAEPVSEKNIAGPGFINVTLASDALAGLLGAFDTPALGVAPRTGTVVVDLCGVNLAKEMHVGHLRATIIGDAMARVFARIGMKSIRQNHLGDWGLPIAMVTGKLMAEVAAGRMSLGTLTLPELERLYRAAQAECDTSSFAVEMITKFHGGKLHAEWTEEFDRVAVAEGKLKEARATLVRLQAKEPATYAVWQRIVDVTVAACVKNCARLHANVTAEHSAGESSYAEELGPLVQDLVTRKVAEESDGAMVVRVDKPEEGGIEEPCLVRKRDGGYLYATTDLAAIRRRVQKFGASRVVYCVDARQSLHFKQVFAAAKKAGYATLANGEVATLAHAAFGTILGEDGKPFKTRSGENVKLADLIDEARDRALAEVTKRRPELAEADRKTIAEAVGVAAIKYADLSNDRMKDYTFSFDRMLAFEGNTGPYLLNALVRIRSIFRKAEERGVGEAWQGTGFAVKEAAERSLALVLLRYPGVLSGTAEACEPHRLCGYLYDLAGAFASFYERCPVLGAEDAGVMHARLRLCDLTARVLADGLECLGIPALERM